MAGEIEAPVTIIPGDQSAAAARWQRWLAAVVNPIKASTRADKISVLMITIISLLSTFLMWGRLEFSACGDGPTYLYGARSILQSGHYLSPSGSTQTMFPPGYPLSVLLFYPVTGDWQAAGRLVSILSSAFGVLLLFWIARRIWQTVPALVAALALAVLPYRLVLGGEVCSEPLYVMLLLAAILLWVRPTAAPGKAAGFGVFAALAYLVRPEGLLPMGCMMLRNLALKDLSLKKRLLTTGIALAALFITALPYLVWLHGHTGSWSLSNKLMINRQEGWVFSQGASWHTRTWLDDQGVSHKLYNKPGFKPPSPAILVRGNLHQIWDSTVAILGGVPEGLAGKGSILPAIVVGIGVLSVLLPLGKNRTGYASRSLLMLSFLAPLASLLLIRVAPRLLIVPMTGALLGLAGLVNIGWERKETRVGRWALVGTGLVLLVVSLPILRGFRAAEMLQDWPGEKKLAAWMVSHNLPAGRMVAGRNDLIYRLQVPCDVCPSSGSLEGLINFARKRGARYIMLTNRQKIDPRRLPLMTERALPGLRRVTAIEEAEHKVVLWEVAPAPAHDSSLHW